MTTIITTNPAALHAKYPVEGIRTRNGEVIAWPDGLPPLTQALVDQAEAEWAARKRPLSRWSFRLAMKPYEALVGQIIDGVQDAALREAIRAKWDHGHLFHFSHDDTQMMLAAILQADPTFDADAVWAVGEAAEYPA